MRKCDGTQIQVRKWKVYQRWLHWHKRRELVSSNSDLLTSCRVCVVKHALTPLLSYNLLICEFSCGFIRCTQKLINKKTSNQEQKAVQTSSTNTDGKQLLVIIYWSTLNVGSVGWTFVPACSMKRHWSGFILVLHGSLWTNKGGMEVSLSL